MNDSKVTAVTANHENRAFLCSVFFYLQLSCCYIPHLFAFWNKWYLCSRIDKDEKQARVKSTGGEARLRPYLRNPFPVAGMPFTILGSCLLHPK